MRVFDYYEFAGILVPGAVVLLASSVLYPQVGAVVLSGSGSAGELGLFVILSYAVGHLVQAVGNLVEQMFWARRGMPTDWVRTKPEFIPRMQVQAMQARLGSKLGLDGPVDIKGLCSSQWSSLVRQIYADVRSQSRARRVDVFNGNYGLNRGLASALLIAAGQVVSTDPCDFRVALLALVGAGLALFRMDRFARNYARELFVEFIQPPQAENRQ